MFRCSFIPTAATPGAWAVPRPWCCRQQEALGGRGTDFSLQTINCPLKAVSRVLHGASVGFPALHLRERQNQCDMVYVVAKLFICHSLFIILDLHKKLWYKESKAPWFLGSSSPAALHRLGPVDAPGRGGSHCDYVQ